MFLACTLNQTPAGRNIAIFDVISAQILKSIHKTPCKVTKILLSDHIQHIFSG